MLLTVALRLKLTGAGIAVCQREAGSARVTWLDRSHVDRVVSTDCESVTPLILLNDDALLN